MIIINKSGYLKYKNLKFRCALGKFGIKKKTKEGDNITPKGIYKILKVFYRKDRIKEIKAPFKKIKITKKIGWCDDIKSKYYNKQISIPTSVTHEKFYRNDNIYDIICVINYNINPTVVNRGSAIFLHIKKGNYKNTKGCVTLKKNHLLKLLASIKKNTKIKIT
jgi:L,D-peptidoglycan transpeptidase YkuD (ErfK/YbiS/YcfS/YnhG family)